MKQIIKTSSLEEENNIEAIKEIFPKITKKNIEDIVNSMLSCKTLKENKEDFGGNCPEYGCKYNVPTSEYKKLINSDEKYYFGMGAEPIYKTFTLYSHKKPNHENLTAEEITNYLIIGLKNNKEHIIANFSNLLNSREDILRLNPDSIYGVYNLKKETETGYELEYLENVMTCYPNQYESLIGKELINPNITILNIGALRQGRIDVLYGNESNIDKNIKPVLLSNGVIEYVESKYIDKYTNEEKTRKHIITTLRDGGAADKMQRTTFAGRNNSDDLFEDLMEEYIGEAPFLGKNKEGDYVLAVGNLEGNNEKYLIDGIEKFLKEKYLKPVKNVMKCDKEFFKNFNESDIKIINEFLDFTDKEINTSYKGYNINYNYRELIEKNKELSEYNFTKKIFERSFPGIVYENLGDILRDIIENKRFLVYEAKEGNIEGLEKDFKEIKIGDKKGNFFVYHDKQNNTIEYREIKQLVKLPDEFESISPKPGRLYLESKNQYPRIPRINNAHNTSELVPTVKYLCERITEN